MAGAALTVLGCLSSCTIVLINNFAIIIGGALIAGGVLVTFGVGWLTGNDAVAEALAKLSQMLKDNLQVEFDAMEVIKNIGAITGTLGISLIVLGVVIVALSCIGCFGACCKIRPCLIIYAVGVGIFFVAQLVVVIIAFADSDTFKSAAKTAMERSLTKYAGSSGINVETLLQDFVQINADCCGVNNGTDFHTLNTHWNRSYTLSDSGRRYTFNLTYPFSCCQFNRGGNMDYSLVDKYCPYNNTASNYRRGCYEAIIVQGWAQLEAMGMSYALYALAGFLGIELLLIAGAIVLFFAAAKDTDEAGEMKTTRTRARSNNKRRNRVNPAV